MVGSNVARTGNADAAPLEPVGGREEAESAERPANPVDHYSLALQVIQVFPIVTSVAYALVAVTWLARALATASLLVGTVYVVWYERRRRKAEPRRADARRAHSQAVVIVQPDEVPAETRAAAAVVDALLNSPALSHRIQRDGIRALGSSTSEAASGEYEGEYREVTISIRISSPGSAAFRHRYRRRRLRESRSRPPANRPALFRHEIGVQPEMALRIVED